MARWIYALGVLAVVASAAYFAKSVATVRAAGERAAQARRAANLDRELLAAVKRGDVPAAQSLVRQGAHVETRNESARTPLMLAAVKGDARMVEALLGVGADVNQRDARGMTPLMWASFGANTQVIQLLKAHGADPKAKDATGQTAGDWSRESRVESRE